MPRGIPNKKKQIKDEAKAKVEKEIKAISDAIENVPTLSNILQGTCKKCSHIKEIHYGGIKGHCNTPNCPCLEFK